MNTFLPATPKVAPCLFVYPRVYQRLTAGEANEKGLGLLMKTCSELAQNRPVASSDRRDGYHFSKAEGFLFVVWSQKENEPDIFIIAGFGDGFGPGHSCPTNEELYRGIYSDLVQVPLLL